jgi:hypothetical protein
VKKKAAGASHRRAREVPNDGRPSPGTRAPAPSGRDPLKDGATTTVATGPAQDVVELLQSEHRTLAALLDRATTRADAQGGLRRELERHAQLEEEIFYPAVGTSEQGAAAVREARAHHREMRKAAADGARGRDAMSALRAAVERHVEIEEKVVFAEARRVLDKDARVRLAERMEQRKRELGG